VNGNEYLVCAEDMCGGQTVIDLTNRQMASYSLDEDGFIWAEFFLSPDGKTLATIGCVWACPFEIRIYDFSDPMNLPLPEIKTKDLIGAETIVGWLDNKTIQIRGTQTEHAKVFNSDGSFSYRVVGEKPIERIIRIDE
jgi:hypothetical protein